MRLGSSGSQPSVVDLRSDTVTRPDDEMRRAMASAEVGDDLFEEDPTVLDLQREAAALLGTEASLFMPSGTMANEIALHLLAKPGEEVICEAESHVLHFEMAAMAVLSGLLPRPVPGDRGLLDPEAVERAIAPELPYRSRTGLITVENTAMMAGGTVYDPQQSRPLVELARRHGLPIHLDGARIFNAAVALEIEVSELTAGFDSVMVSLSKGLGAPAGSLLAGASEFIREARRVRRMLGGTMRQVGVLAAAALVGLRKGPALLERDHTHAQLLAEAIRELPGLDLDPPQVETNIVIFGVTGGFFPAAGIGQSPALELIDRLREHGVLAVTLDRDRARFVTHRDLDRAQIDRAIEALRSLSSKA